MEPLLVVGEEAAEAEEAEVAGEGVEGAAVASPAAAAAPDELGLGEPLAGVVAAGAGSVAPVDGMATPEGEGGRGQEVGQRLGLAGDPWAR